MTELEYGTVRQVWFAAHDTPETKYSFLIRDDAQSEKAAVYGRTVRLGESVNLGPNGTWRQLSWQGGQDQDTWRDAEMYKSASADGLTERGKLKLGKGLTQLFYAVDGLATHYIMCSSTETNPTEPTDLYLGTCNLWFEQGVHNDDYALFRYNAGTNTGSLIKGNFHDSIQDVKRAAADTAGAGAINIAAGDQLWVYPEAGATVYQDTAKPSGTTEWVSLYSLTDFGGDTYYCTPTKLYKRVGNTTNVLGIHTVVKEVLSATMLGPMTVWNNRLWFAASYGFVRAALWVSDGVTAQKALDFPDDFFIEHLKVHYGSLYITGYKPAFPGHMANDATIAQLWRYNGSALTKLFEMGTGHDDVQHTFGTMASNGPILAWGRPANAVDGKRAGLWYYDAELDAIAEGPTVEMPTESVRVKVPFVEAYGSTFVMSLWDETVYEDAGGVGVDYEPMVAAHVHPTSVRHTFSLGGVSFQDQENTKSQFVLSSLFDGELPNDAKVWLNLRLRVRLAIPGSELAVYVLLDGSTTENLLGTIGYTADDVGWRDVTLPVTASSAYLRSTTIQYKLYLRNVAITATPTWNAAATPEVDSVEIDFLPSPTPRREFNMRIYASNDQQTLENYPNDLATTDEIVGALRDFWSAGVPFKMWGPLADDGTEPDETTDSGSTVIILSDTWLVQPVRTSSESEDVHAEVSFRVLEIAESVLT